jgi:hypothetical protein
MYSVLLPSLIPINEFACEPSGGDGASYGPCRAASVERRAMMQRLLRYLCEVTPGRLLLRVWLALLGIAVVQSLIPHPITAFLGLIGALLAMFGYSIVVVIGLRPHASGLARGIVRCSALAFVGLAVLAALDSGRGHAGEPPTLVGAIVLLFVLAPSFVATHVVGEARRAAGLYKPTDFIGTWLVLYFFAFGGAWWARRQVRAVVR